MCSGESARHDANFGEGTRDGQGTRQQVTQPAGDCSVHGTTPAIDPTFEKARSRALAAVAAALEAPEMMRTLREYARDCVARGQRITAVGAFGDLRNKDFVSCRTGDYIHINSNHMVFYLRVLAHEDADVAACMRPRKSMFDLLDVGVYARLLAE